LEVEVVVVVEVAEGLLLQDGAWAHNYWQEGGLERL